MFIVREVLHCKPGKVRPMLENFRAISAALRQRGGEPLRLMTDVSGDPFWTLVVEATVPNVDAFFEMMDAMSADESIRARMAGYHDLIQSGRREVYRLES